jgi:hypothetical protein
MARQQSWKATGTVRLSRTLDPDRWQLLAEEALALAKAAEPFERDGTAAHRDGSFASPACCALARGGPTLEALAYDRAVVAALREATGLPRLVPIGCALVVYRRGDFQGLHTDSIKSTVTVGIALTENLSPMGWAPALREAHPDTLAQVIADRGLFPEGDGFQTLEHPGCCGDLQGFAGYDIPHWRPPFDGDLAVLATLSYMSV